MEEVRYTAYVAGSKGQFPQAIELEKQQGSLSPSPFFSLLTLGAVLRINEEKQKLVKDPYIFRNQGQR